MPQAAALAARANNANYKFLYDFSALPDEGAPTASLIDVGGTLYGTTDAGGTSGKGTVFALTP